MNERTLVHITINSLSKNHFLSSFLLSSKTKQDRQARTDMQANPSVSTKLRFSMDRQLRGELLKNFTMIWDLKVWDETGDNLIGPLNGPRVVVTNAPDTISFKQILEQELEGILGPLSLGWATREALDWIWLMIWEPENPIDFYVCRD